MIVSAYIPNLTEGQELVTFIARTNLTILPNKTFVHVETASTSQVDIAIKVNSLFANAIDPHIRINGTTPSYDFDPIAVSRGSLVQVFIQSPPYGVSGITVVFDCTEEQLDSVVFYHEGKLPTNSTIMSTIVPKTWNFSSIFVRAQSPWIGAGSSVLSIRKNNSVVGTITVSLGGFVVNGSSSFVQGDRLTITTTGNGEFINDGLQDLSISLT